MLDKAGRGLYWTIATGRAAELGGPYVKLFESYLNELLQAGGIVAPRYYPGPKFRDGAEVCDGLFVEGSRLVMCEYKSSVLPVAAKLSVDPGLLSEKIDLAFVKGDDEGRKGVAQIRRSIERILDGDEILGIPTREWTTIHPAMVCVDAAMNCPGMSAYINEQFDRPRRRGHRIVIPPVVLIDVEDFESLVPDLASHSFAEMLDSYYYAYSRGPLGQVVRFRRMNIPFLDGTPAPTSDPVETRFKAFFAELGPRVFGL